MFEDYLRELRGEDRAALTALIEHVAALVPDAEEGTSYGLAAFRYRGKPLLGFAAHRDHLGVYPFSPAVLDAVRPQLVDHGTSKGAIRVSPDRPLPDDVVTALVTVRKAEIDGSVSAEG